MHMSPLRIYLFKYRPYHYFQNDKDRHRSIMFENPFDAIWLIIITLTTGRWVK